jgi:hypothetical protein
MDRNKLSHEILNLLERLRIMHDFAKDLNFTSVKKEELLSDLDETLEHLEKNFKELIQ